MYLFAPAFKVSLRLVVEAFCFVLAGSGLHASPISLPSGFLPLTSIEYVTAPDASGVRLILGDCTLDAFAAIRSLPLPSSDNEQFADSSIELAQGQFFRHVYIPTLAERQGDFQDFGGPILDPLGGAYFPENIIPASRLADYYAFRLGPAATPAPEPGPLYTLALVAIAVTARLLARLVV